MNSQDYRNLQEAYLQVYAPQELTEEQVWEEVEYWVNSLLEEGYDLSDYTWEEMYEEYLSEVANTQTPQQRAEFQKKVDTANKREIGNIKKVGGDALNVANRLLNPAAAVGDGLKRAGNELNYVKKSGLASYDPTIQKPAAKTITPNISAERPKSKFAGARDAAIEKAKQIKGSPVVGEKPRPTTPAPSSGTPTPRPAAASPAASRPTATSSGPKTTPTAPVKPAMGTTAGGTKFERRTPTSAELGAAQASRAAGGSEEDAIKAGVGVSKPAPTPAASPSSSSGSSSPSGETDRLKKALDIKKSDVTSSFDMFDVVKGYLIGEGYADTEEAALAIMANMSEDWRDSICEGMKPLPLPVGKMDAKAKELKSKFRKSKVGTPESSKLLSRLSHIVATRDSKVV